MGSQRFVSAIEMVGADRFRECTHLRIEIWGTQFCGGYRCGPPARAVRVLRPGSAWKQRQRRFGWVIAEVEKRISPLAAHDGAVSSFGRNDVGLFWVGTGKEGNSVRAGRAVFIPPFAKCAKDGAPVH